MIDISPKDGTRYGYYEIGAARTYSKIELMDLHYRHPANWKWWYHDEFFGSFDWSQEPSANINELYRRRAEQLRRDYDYLVLYYSGGYDSANMLYAFLDNGIPVDEVCVFYSRYDQESNQYLELSGLTWNKVDYLKNKYPTLNVRALDYSDYFPKWDQHLASLGFGDALLEMFGNMLTINRMAVDFAYTLVPEWQTLLDQGKKLGFIMGADKPMMRYNNGEWIFNFHDGIVHARVTPIRQLVDQGQMGVMEFFYWAPESECVDILRKQCHNIKNKFSAQAARDFSSIPGSKPFKPGYGWEFDTMSAGFVEAIYPRLFTTGEHFFTAKNPQHIFGNRDQWFFNSNHESALLHQQIYLSTHSDLYSHRKSWFNNGNTIFDGIRNCISPDYKI